MEFGQAVPEEQGLAAQLLRAVFPAQPEEFTSHAFLQWKFFAPRPGMTGSRGFVIRADGQVRALAGEWPANFLTPAGEVQCCHVIDWAADSAIRGAGVFLFQQLLEKNEIVFVIGGSAQARKLLPRLGLETYSTIKYFAMVTRPWRQFRLRPSESGWRKWVRLGRNFAWSLKTKSISRGEWTATAATGVSDIPESVYRFASTTFSTAIRSPAWLEYLMACPLMNCTLFLLSRSGAPAGYCLTNLVLGQCRIIDLAIASESPQDWLAAYGAAAVAAMKQKDCCEVMTISSLPWLSDGLEKLGFLLRKEVPVMVHDLGRKLFDTAPIFFRFTDNDECILYEKANPFLT